MRKMKFEKNGPANSSRKMSAAEKLNNIGVGGETDAFCGILKILEKLPLKIFHNKIFPFGRRTKEIDIVCFGRRKIYLFEVKKLRGRIECLDGARWRQSWNGGEKEIKNGFGQAAEAKKALVEYLAGELEIKPEDLGAKVNSSVLFVGDKFDPTGIEKYRKSFILEKNLESYLYLNELDGAVVGYFEKAIELVEKTGGMHVIKLLNGAVHRGSIESDIMHNEAICKGGLIGYETFLRLPEKLDLENFDRLSFRGKLSEMTMVEAFSIKTRESKILLLAGPAIGFKPRGEKAIEIPVGEIEYISMA